MCNNTTILDHQAFGAINDRRQLKNGEMLNEEKEHSMKKDFSEKAIDQGIEKSNSKIGAIGRIIGAENPKLSIAFCVIVLSFLAGLSLSFGKPVDDIVTIWSIFVPIITGAVGYIFGTNSKNKIPPSQ